MWQGNANENAAGIRITKEIMEYQHYVQFPEMNMYIHPAAW